MSNSKIYMQLSGIEGDVTCEKHKGWIQLDALSFGTGRSVSQEAGSGKRNIGTASVSGISCSKIMDKSTPRLFTESVSSTALKCVIHFIHGNNAKEFMEYKLENAIISNYRVSFNAQMKSPSESFEISFTKIESIHTQFDEDGKPTSPTSAGYDIGTAKKV